ncbi:MAG: cobalt-precorrin-6A reductase, partial [Microcoleus sp.]
GQLTTIEQLSTFNCQLKNCQLSTDIIWACIDRVKAGAKHSDINLRIYCINYRPNASPLQVYDVRKKTAKCQLSTINYQSIASGDARTTTINYHLSPINSQLSTLNYQLSTDLLMKKRLLILGGTGDAAQLAARVSQIPEIEVITSLAGRTQQPATVAGAVRIGGFGGADGLVQYLQNCSIDLLIDATHPFADRISLNAAVAAAKCQIPHLILVRPPWQQIEGDRWIEVESHAVAARVLSQQSQRVFLTIGRQELGAFSGLDNIWFLMRAIDPPAPEIQLPPGNLLLAKGPFFLKSELHLLQEYQIDTVVSKNSGGDATYAKIVAARQMKIPVVMVQRTPLPESEKVADVAGAISWILSHLS